MPNHHRLSNQEGLSVCRILFSKTAYGLNFKVMVITYASEFNTGNCGTQSKYSICKASMCDGGGQWIIVWFKFCQNTCNKDYFT